MDNKVPLHQRAGIRYQADVMPTIIVILSFATLMATWLYIDNGWIWLAVNIALLVPRAMSTVFVHNQAHLATFKGKIRNFFLDTFLYFLSGMMTSKFKLHHNLGHHLHYLDPNLDPSTWTHKNGKIMSRGYYMLRYYMTHTYFSIKIGLKHTKLLKQYIVQQTWLLGILITLFVLKPEATLYLFFIPMTFYWMVFISVTYDDHVGLDSKDPLEASFSKTTDWINLIVLNNGYHLVHHLKPGLHWSKLPEYHKQLEPELPHLPAYTGLNKFSARLEEKKKKKFKETQHA